MATAGALVSGASFLSAIATTADYAYLSSTTIANATASLAAGNITSAAYAAATSAAAVSTAVAGIDVRQTSPALYCTFLAVASANSSDDTVTGLYSTICLVPPSPPPLPPPPSPPPPSPTMVAPAFASLAGVALLNGYLSNCTAFLDLDQNERLDSGEPFAATGSSGAYTLTISQVCGLLLRLPRDSGLFFQFCYLSMHTEMLLMTKNPFRAGHPGRARQHLPLPQLVVGGVCQ